MLYVNYTKQQIKPKESIREGIIKTAAEIKELRKSTCNLENQQNQSLSIIQSIKPYKTDKVRKRTNYHWNEKNDITPNLRDDKKTIRSIKSFIFTIFKTLDKFREKHNLPN